IGLFFLFREIGWMPHLGIALATSIGGWLNAGLLWLGLIKRGLFKTDARLARVLPLILASSFAMGVVLSLLAAELDPWFGAGNSLLVRVAALGTLVGAGAAVYFLVAQLTGAARLELIRAAMRRR
ncbi:MAG TPA: lipid II flippase MurJ, partial [Hyphomicrobium sp.]